MTDYRRFTLAIVKVYFVLLRCGEQVTGYSPAQRLRFVGHDRQTTRLLQPPRQVLLVNTGLARELPGAHRVSASEPLDQLLLKPTENGLVITSSSPRPTGFKVKRRDNYPGTGADAKVMPPRPGRRHEEENDLSRARGARRCDPSALHRAPSKVSSTATAVHGTRDGLELPTPCALERLGHRVAFMTSRRRRPQVSWLRSPRSVKIGLPSASGNAERRHRSPLIPVLARSGQHILFNGRALDERTS